MARVLLVEDSKLQQMLYQRVLTRDGYEVITAVDGEEAVSVARRELPDLILLDMLLPKIDGPEVLSILKNDLRTKHIPVILLSGLSENNVSALIRDTASAFIDKVQAQTDANALLQLVRQLLTDNSCNLPQQGLSPGRPLEMPLT